LFERVRSFEVEGGSGLDQEYLRAGQSIHKLSVIKLISSI